MTPHEYDKRNINRRNDLVMEMLNNPPHSQRDKDLYNLKHMLYGIGHGSRYFRYGCVSTLQRAISRLEGGEGEPDKI